MGWAMVSKRTNDNVRNITHATGTLLFLSIVATIFANFSAASNFSSDHLYSLEGRAFSYDTIVTLDQNYTVDDCSML